MIVLSHSPVTCNRSFETPDARGHTSPTNGNHFSRYGPTNGTSSWFPVTIVSVVLAFVIEHDGAGALFGTIHFVLPVKCTVVALVGLHGVQQPSGAIAKSEDTCAIEICCRS